MLSDEVAPRAGLVSRMRVAAAVSLLLTAALVAHADEPIKPVPLPVGLDAKKVELGRGLFNDKRLSRDNSISCSSCHDLARGGVDGKVMAVGVGGVKGVINTPTVLNSALNFRQFWDGRAASLEEQVAGPVHDVKEMGSNWAEVTGKLMQDARLREQFGQSYRDGITGRNIQDAIATYERTLVTPNSRMDKYLRGDKTALSADEQRGYQLFKNYGCIACHQGANVGGNMYQTFGVLGDYFAQRGRITPADLGRFNVTKNESDRHVFKVPSLRNVALTAPYFHDGGDVQVPARPQRVAAGQGPDRQVPAHADG
jgi:cytochrome c peroxidase